MALFDRFTNESKAGFLNPGLPPRQTPVATPAAAPVTPVEPTPSLFGARYFTEPFVKNDPTGTGTTSNVIGALKTGFNNMLGRGGVETLPGTQALTPAPAAPAAPVVTKSALTRVAVDTALAARRGQGSSGVTARAPVDIPSASVTTPDFAGGFANRDFTPVTATATDPGPMITQNLTTPGTIFDSKGADTTGNPGLFRFSADGTNGGFGLTRNADGTVDEMYNLRQRTTGEDKIADTAMVQWEKDHPFGTEGIPQPRDMSPGSQGAWEEQQRNLPDGQPFFFKRRAMALADRTQAESAAVAQQNADTQSRYHGILGNAVLAKTPAELEKLRDDLLTSAANRGEINAKTSGILETNKTIVPLAQSEFDLRGSQVSENKAKTAGVLEKNKTIAPESAATINYMNRFSNGDVLANKVDGKNTVEAEAGKAYLEHLKLNPGDLTGAVAAADGVRKMSEGLVPIPGAAAQPASGSLWWKRPAQPAGATAWVNPADAPPAGFRNTGRTSNGKPVYKSADGKQSFIPA